MSKFYFNSVAGNNYEGYMLTYINDDGTKNEFRWMPTIDDEVSGVANIHLNNTLCNTVPYKVMNNTLLTPNAWFDFAEDMSFFDPMNVLDFQRTGNNLQTSLMLAFPPVHGNFIAFNHMVDAYVPSPETIVLLHGGVGPGGLDSPNYYQNTAVVHKDLKKELFTYAYSTNIEELEEQLNKSWESISKASTTSGATYCRFPVTSDKSVKYSENMSFSPAPRGTGGMHIIPHGIELDAIIYNERHPDFNNWLVRDTSTNIKIENVLSYNSSNKTYEKIGKSTYIVDTIYKDSIPSKVNFVQSIYTLKIIGGSDIQTYLIPIINDNNRSEYYFQVVSLTSNSSIIKPDNIEINLAYVGNIKLYKESNKWVLKFLSPSIIGKSISVGSNESIGYFEGNGSVDPMNSDTGLDLTYVHANGEKSTSPYLNFIKLKDSSSKSKDILFPDFFGDSRVTDEDWYATFGTYIRPKAKLYPSSFIKEKTYISVDSGSYTYAI